MIDSAVTPEVVPSAHKDCRRSPQIDEASGRAYVTAMALSAHDIRLAFDALSTELQDIGERSEIVIVGGAALALLFGARETTKDVDAVILTPEAATVRNAVARVADRLHLPEDWLNDGAKGFVVEITLGAVVYESSFLCVRAASTMQLMAMKLAAWRDAVDREDARILLKSIPGFIRRSLGSGRAAGTGSPDGQGFVCVRGLMGVDSWISLTLFAPYYRGISWPPGNGWPMRNERV